MNEFKVQKRNGGVIHAGYEFNEYVMSDCGAGRLHNRAGATEARTWVKVEGEITCKRCLKKIAAQTQIEATEARRQQAKAEIAKPKPDIDAHAAAVAQMRANIDAEEEERAAARRARNRSNYKRAEKTGIESLRDMLKLS